MRKKWILFILFVVTTGILLGLTGCETPKGGSSVPWNQPEPWEGDVMRGFPINRS